MIILCPFLIQTYTRPWSSWITYNILIISWPYDALAAQTRPHLGTIYLHHKSDTFAAAALSTTSRSLDFKSPVPIIDEDLDSDMVFGRKIYESRSDWLSSIRSSYFWRMKTRLKLVTGLMAYDDSETERHLKRETYGGEEFKNKPLTSREVRQLMIPEARSNTAKIDVEL